MSSMVLDVPEQVFNNLSIFVFETLALVAFIVFVVCALVFFVDGPPAAMSGGVIAFFIALFSLVISVALEVIGLVLVLKFSLVVCGGLFMFVRIKGIQKTIKN